MENKNYNEAIMVGGIVTLFLLLGGVYFYYANYVNPLKNNSTKFTQDTQGKIDATIGIIDDSKFDTDTPSEFPIVSFQLFNNTGKIITKADFNVSIIGDDGSRLLLEQIEHDLDPGMLPGKSKDVSQSLSFKWTQAALESTLGISSITQANIVVEINKLKDVDNQTYYPYGVSTERIAEVKEIYAQIQAISTRIKSYREQINAGYLDQGSLDAFNKEITLLSTQSRKLDPDGWISIEHHDIIQGEIAEAMLISSIQVVAETKK